MTKRIALFVVLLIVSWVTMVATHEGGHIFGGLAGGGTLVDYDLAPWRMPYSFFAPDPYPLVTLWAGPLLGVLVPIMVAGIARKPWLWFIADFCLLANGIYLALAWLSGDRLLDTPRLLNAGADPATLLVFCYVTIGIGYLRFRSDCFRYLSINRRYT